MKRRRYIQLALAVITLLIIGGTVLLNSPKMQQRAAVWAATELENRIGTRVSLGKVHWLFPNDIVIDSLTIDDQEGDPLISVGRMAAKVEWMPLIRQRQLSVRNIRLFGPDINIYKTGNGDEYNYRFLIDAFASKEKRERESGDLSLRVNTLILRDGMVRYQGERTLGISDLSAQLALKALSADSISLIVRHLGFKEQSGLQLDDLYFRLVGNHQGATLANFQMDFPRSSLRLDTVWASYAMDDIRHSLIVKGGILPTSHISPSDLSFAFPQVQGLAERVYIGGDFIGTPSRIGIKSLDIHTERHDLTLRADARLNLSHAVTSSSISDFSLHLEEGTITRDLWMLLADGSPELYMLIPKEVIRVGDISAKGNMHIEGNNAGADLQACTDAGNLTVRFVIDDKGHYTAALDGDSLDVVQIIPTSPLESTDLTLQAKGQWSPGQRLTLGNLHKSLTADLQATLTHTRMLGYEYEHIALDGQYTPKNYNASLHLSDPHGRLGLQAAYNANGHTPHCTVMLDADSLDLYSMGLISLHEGNTFSTHLTADLHGNDIDHMKGKVNVDSLTMHRPSGDYLIEEIALYSSDSKDKMLSLKSDFMDATLRGELTYRSLINSLLGHLHHSLPSLCRHHEHGTAGSPNLCLASIEVYNTTPLRELLLLPVSTTGKGKFDILVNDAAEELKLTASIPQIIYNDNLIKGVSLDLHSTQQGLNLYAGATLHDEASPSLTASLVTTASDDVANLTLLWSSNPAGAFEGSFSTQATLMQDDAGSLNVGIATDSTMVVLNHSEWVFDPFRVHISPRHIDIDKLHFASATQHLSADGTITPDAADTLQVDFTGLDLGYLLSVVGFKAISFDGKLSGHADMAGLYSPTPYIEASLSAQDFIFSEGELGNLDGDIHWNQEDEQLQFTADVSEEPTHITEIDGYVDFGQEELWIDIAADSTNISFLNSMLKSFMSDIKGHAYGDITIGGPLQALNLDGALLTDVNFNLTPTDVRYHFRDSLRFTPDVIHFNGIEVFDHREQKAIVSGTVKHNAIKDFAADLYVDAQNILGIDLPDTGHDSFYTTIYGTGGVHITTSPTAPLVIDIQAQSEKGSVFALNLAPQNESQSEKFITFTDRSDTRNTPTSATLPPTRRSRRQPEGEASTIININAQVTPDAMLKLVMNQSVDDHISISGNGDLQISAQGSDINLHGTYTANRGFYRLNLQDVITKNFDVLPGSTVSFDGDYMDARLNITARHIVNYVPLRDLSPEMPGNVHVNCLLHIGGTLSTPTLTFDLELPKGTEEEKSILRSYTSTEEQMNLQFIYLLGLGKFYTPDLTQGEQGTGNVESFISNTISGQINNLLANIISNDNWNFASNLRAENMMTGESDLDGENWDNMEIEGILEGRLLDNRLLINGSFGYRENPMYATNFVGDFDIRYLLKGGFSLKGYNKTNDRYFSRTSLTTQGVGLVFQRDFENLLAPNKQQSPTPTTRKKNKERKASRK